MSSGKKPSFCYKYICEECGEATFFNRRERTRRSKMRCSHCGSGYMEPSPSSFARDNIPVFHDFKVEHDERVARKRRGE